MKVKTPDVRVPHILRTARHRMGAALRSGVKTLYLLYINFANLELNVCILMGVGANYTRLSKQRTQFRIYAHEGIGPVWYVLKDAELR